MDLWTKVALICGVLIGLGRAGLRCGEAQTTVASLDAAPNGYHVLRLNSKAIYMKTEEDCLRDLLDR
jgi:hypothetical protein